MIFFFCSKMTGKFSEKLSGYWNNRDDFLQKSVRFYKKNNLNFYYDRRRCPNGQVSQSGTLRDLFDESGTGGRTRTATPVKAGDFESPMSTNSITPALG